MTAGFKCANRGFDLPQLTLGAAAGHHSNKPNCLCCGNLAKVKTPLIILSVQPLCGGDQWGRCLAAPLVDPPPLNDLDRQCLLKDRELHLCLQSDDPLLMYRRTEALPAVSPAPARCDAEEIGAGGGLRAAGGGGWM